MTTLGDMMNLPVRGQRIKKAKVKLKKKKKAKGKSNGNAKVQS